MSRVDDIRDRLEAAARKAALADWVSPAEVARIRAEAWDEGRAHGIRYPYGERGFGTDDNPYRAAAATEGAGEKRRGQR